MKVQSSNITVILTDRELQLITSVTNHVHVKLLQYEHLLGINTHEMPLFISAASIKLFSSAFALWLFVEVEKSERKADDYNESYRNAALGVFVFLTTLIPLGHYRIAHHLAEWRDTIKQISEKIDTDFYKLTVKFHDNFFDKTKELQKDFMAIIPGNPIEQVKADTTLNEMLKMVETILSVYKDTSISRAKMIKILTAQLVQNQDTLSRLTLKSIIHQTRLEMETMFLSHQHQQAVSRHNDDIQEILMMLEETLSRFAHNPRIREIDV